MSTLPIACQSEILSDAMSQENVEIVRRTIEAFEAGAERGDFEAAWETGPVAEDVEWIAFAELEQRSYTGRAGFVEFMRGWTEDFEGWPAQLEQLVLRRTHARRYCLSYALPGPGLSCTSHR